MNGCRKSDSDARGTRQPRAIAQKSASSGKGYRDDWCAGSDSSLESAKLERPHAVLASKRSFRKNKNGFAMAQKFLDLLRLAQSRFRASAVKLEVPHLLQECADERHSADFHFRDEAVRDSQTKRSEEHTSELQSPDHLVCRLLLEKKKKTPNRGTL